METRYKNSGFEERKEPESQIGKLEIGKIQNWKLETGMEKNRELFFFFSPENGILGTRPLLF